MEFYPKAQYPNAEDDKEQGCQQERNTATAVSGPASV